MHWKTTTCIKLISFQINRSVHLLLHLRSSACPSQLSVSWTIAMWSPNQRFISLSINWIFITTSVNSYRGFLSLWIPSTEKPQQMVDNIADDIITSRPLSTEHSLWIEISLHSIPPNVFLASFGRITNVTWETIGGAVAPPRPPLGYALVII